MDSSENAPVWPYLWSRDGFLGTNSVVVRERYLPTYRRVRGPNAPHRFSIFDIPADDRRDVEALPTVVLTSREGLEFSVTQRRAPTPYTVRNAEGDELYFIQTGQVRFVTDFGAITAGPLDFVCLPRAVAYRVEPLDGNLTALIMSSPRPLRIDTPAPLGMIYQRRSIRYPSLADVKPVEGGSHRLWIKSFDGVTEFESAEDPLPGVALAEGPCPVWALNLREINPMTYGGPGGPPGQFLTTADTAVMSYSMSARAGLRPPVHVNADYDELILFAEGPGAWGAINEPGILTWVPKSVMHHGPNENVPEGYQAWLIEVRPTMRLTPAAQRFAKLIETSQYAPLDESSPA